MLLFFPSSVFSSVKKVEGESKAQHLSRAKFHVKSSLDPFLRSSLFVWRRRMPHCLFAVVISVLLLISKSQSLVLHNASLKELLSCLPRKYTLRPGKHVKSSKKRPNISLFFCVDSVLQYLFRVASYWRTKFMGMFRLMHT